MTNNQILYAQHLETQRHNRASEKLGISSLDETIRHNQASESIGWYQQTEQARHNFSTEDINWYQNQTNRAAVNATAAYQSGQLVLGAVGAAQNAAKLVQDYELRRYANLTERLNANTNKRNAATREAELKEAHRSNIVNESIGRGRFYVDSILKGTQAAVNVKGLFGRR